MAVNADTSEGQPVLDVDALKEVLEAHRAAAEPAVPEGVSRETAEQKTAEKSPEGAAKVTSAEATKTTT